MLTRRLARSWYWLRQNPVSHWCVLFVVLSTTVSLHDNNVNPYSRYALLSAIAEDHTLAIDAYRKDTCDWSHAPDGHYYSNKAPGAALLALPFYLPVDALVVAHAGDRATRDARRLQARDAVLDYLAIVMQVIPFALLVMVGASLLTTAGASRPALELAALAVLFGNTASLLMNMFYGHGLTVVLTLGLALAGHRRRFFWVGLLLGLAVLTDYSSALFAPIVLGFALAPGSPTAASRPARLARLGLGGLAPFLLFVGYHKLCFGGAFTLPNKYQNPVFVEVGQRALWGVIDFLPNPRVAYALLFGPGRGLLFTQPWVLVLTLLLPGLLWRRRLGETRRALGRILLPLGFLGLLLLFLMNASFGGWHGGVCPGPRYLSAALPLVGLALGLAYDRLPRPARAVLWLTVLPSLVIFAIVWAGDVAVWPQHQIWRRCHETLYKFGLVKSYLRLGWIGLAFAVTALVALARLRLARAYLPSAGRPASSGAGAPAAAGGPQPAADP
jgi:hypothetical protein